MRSGSRSVVSALSRESNRSSEDDDDKLQLKGHTISAARGTYTVVRLLGSGGFGAVYRVFDVQDPTKFYAMKCEKKMKKDSKLKMEYAILRLVSDERKHSHFTQIIDRGRNDVFFFVVMQLVGKSLSDLKAMRPNGVFSMGTGLGVALQCLEACEDLHKHGFIHRDIKPPNFACGLAEKNRTIYMLDFGISRKITNEAGQLKTPREKVRFKGTIRFAPIACHREKEMGPKDDCESWFYLLLDLVKLNGLPWRNSYDRSAVLRMKEECRTVRRYTFIGWSRCAMELGRILDYIDELQYHDKVDYEFVYKLVVEMILAHGATLASPYDWED